MHARNRRSWLRKLRASWRDTLLLLREFQQPLLLFILLVGGSGCLFFNLSKTTQQPLDSLVEAVYGILTMTFLQPIQPFPTQWYLQIFYFLTPLAGIAIVALGLTDFGVLLFNRRARGKEWEMAVASTFNNHIVLVGLGHLGYRVVKQLTEMDQDVVVIEMTPRPDLLVSVRELGIPVIEGDATNSDALHSAGVARARTIILCTQNDSLNLEVALKARNINPAIEVVVRIFDDEFAESLQKQFGFRALSATGMAAPLFAASAANVDITPPITIEGRPHILARMEIKRASHLNGLSVNQIEERFQTSLVLLLKDGTTAFHPAANIVVNHGDTIAVFGAPEQINQLLHENK